MTGRSAELVVQLRAAPWAPVAGLTAAGVVVGGTGAGLAGASETLTPALLAVGFSLGAGATAWILDEEGAEIIDATPTGPGRRALGRAFALVVPVVGMLTVVAATAVVGGPVWSPVGLVLAAIGPIAVGFAGATTARRWTGQPGMWVSTATIVALVSVPLIGRLGWTPTTVPSVVGRTGERGGPTCDEWWAAVVAAAVAVTTLAWVSPMIGGAVGPRSAANETSGAADASR